MALVVGVSAITVTYPTSVNEAPTCGHAKVFPEITAGKVGGLQQESQL